MTAVELTTGQMLHMLRHGLPRTSNAQDIVVIGAGMAGLYAAGLLKQAGHRVTILEANTIVGGRVRTLRDPYFSDGLYCEVGAMRIPDDHQLVLELIAQVGLENKLNTFIEQQPSNPIFVNGVLTTFDAYGRNPDIVGYPTQGNERGKTADDLWNLAVQPIIDYINEDPNENWPKVVGLYDQYSVRTFLKATPPPPPPARGIALSEGAIEMIGVLLDEEELMMTSFLQAIRDQADINPNTTYHELLGGNDQLPRALVRYYHLADQVVLGARVTAIAQAPVTVPLTPSVVITYERGGQEYQVRCRRAIVTTPFSALRLVDTSGAQFQSGKRKAIRELHYDTSTKICLEFNSRFWETRDASNNAVGGGNTPSDLPIRFTYYPSHGIGQPGPAVLVASYTWCDDSLRWDSLPDDNGDPQGLRIRFALRDLAKIYGDIVYREWSKRGVSHSWLRDEFTCGAFSLFEPEQQSELFEFVAVPEGNIHFAGEHTTLKPAWIEGAVESATRVAAELVHAIDGEAALAAAVGP